MDSSQKKYWKLSELESLAENTVGIPFVLIVTLYEVVTPSFVAHLWNITISVDTTVGLCPKAILGVSEILGLTRVVYFNPVGALAVRVRV